jgi:hypothetical protein
MARGRPVVTLVLLVAAVVATGANSASAATGDPARGGADPAFVVDLRHSHSINPFQALGTSIDSFDAVQGMTHQLGNGDTDQAGNDPGRRPYPGFDKDLFTTAQAMSPGNVAHLATSGLRPLSYRLVTELRLEDWHWSETGHHSAGAKGGYWTSTASANSPAITESYGYDIAHGGTSLPGGETAYVSRLDDGDPATFWKSNPYLDERYTHESDARHPQWAVVDLGRATPIDTVRIRWADPYAVSYRVQAWRPVPGADDPSPFDAPDDGAWRDLPGGTVEHATGGDSRLSVGPTTAEYVRVLMGASSHTCAGGDDGDVRNCTGFAIRELSVGSRSGDGFHDAVRHGDETVQSATFVSSNDPAEEASPVRGFDQPGVDSLFDSGVAQGLPAMVPVPLLYSTPDNAVALIKYLKAKGRTIGSVEIGEEPDGEYMAPEDFAALWVQWATAIHAVDPTIVLGGPALQDATASFWNDRDRTDTDHGTRLIAYLRDHGHLGDLRFYSFEQFPFFDSTSPADDYQFLLDEPSRSAAVLRALRATIPADIPLYCTEQSTYGERALFGLWQADFDAAMFTGGLAADFNYQALPTHLFTGGIAANLFLADSHGQWSANTATYYSSTLVGNKWLQPVNAMQTLHPVAVPAFRDAKGNQLLSAYAVKRPDHTWALLVINKSQDHTFTAPVRIGGSGFTGHVDSSSWGQQQYVWHDNGMQGYASPDSGPVHASIVARSTTAYTFAPFSITVLRGTS